MRLFDRLPVGAERLVLIALAGELCVGFTWGLPNGQSWAADSISPRSCGLGAIVETYWPGHFHTYPPLHMALLTILTLPWMALAAFRVGTGVETLAEELIKPLYMTGIEVSARLLTAIMALAIVHHTMRLWGRIAGRRAGALAGVVLCGNATFVYYGHTGNLEVPYLFWTSWALLELDRVVAGEGREREALVLGVAAVLTKDQAAATLLIPIALCLIVVLVAYGDRRLHVRRWAVGGTAAIAVYAVISGALVNPMGFRRRLELLFGPASQTWARYPRGIGGATALARDALNAISHFGGRPIACLAIVGLGVVVATFRGIERVRALVPFAAAASFTLLFTLPVRRSEDRFLLPQSLFLLPYAAVAADRAWAAFARVRPALAVVGLASLVPAALGVASMDGTLLADARYTAEAFLAQLPRGARVDVYGGAVFLPRIPEKLAAVRPGVEPVSDRQRIAGVEELVDPAMDPRARAPDAIVLATDMSEESVTRPADRVLYGVFLYSDPVSRALFRSLRDGSLGYARAARAVCTLPWPLECQRIHGSTGRDVWIYEPTGHAPESTQR